MNLEQSALSEAAFNLFINIFISSSSIVFTLKVVQNLHIIKTSLATSSYPTNFFLHSHWLMISQIRGGSWVYTRGVKIDWSERVPAECWRGSGRQEWGYFWKVMWLKKARLCICFVFLLLNWGSKQKTKNYAGDTMLGGTVCVEEDQDIWIRWITKDWSKKKRTKFNITKFKVMQSQPNKNFCQGLSAYILETTEEKEKTWGYSLAIGE